MKTVFAVLCFGLLVFGAATANATPYTWVDAAAITDKYVEHGSTSTFTHDLTDNSPVFHVGEDSITSYSVKLTFHDDKRPDIGCIDLPEIFIVDQPGLTGDRIVGFSMKDLTLGWSLQGLVQLNQDGKLTITITSLLGDFYIDSSTLKANGNDNPSPVPEPGTLLLLGSGLVGLGIFRKRFKRS